MYSGVLMMDKPHGMTSHDVVAAVRRCLGMRAVGHTGTLDPEASGLLLLCLGRGTKFARFFEALEKTYWAVMRLGVCTDTQDATGSVTRQCDVATVEKAQVETVLAQFRGAIQQVPPMYSAVKHRGQRLYHLARQGQIVPRDPREVFIRRLELLHVEGPWVTLSVTCSKGTYIRTLCEDIGLALGYGAICSTCSAAASARSACGMRVRLSVCNNTRRTAPWRRFCRCRKRWTFYRLCR